MWVGAMFFPFPCANDCESEIIKADTDLYYFFIGLPFQAHQKYE